MAMVIMVIILRCQCIAPSASLDRHAQLTRCFSAVAELLVGGTIDLAKTSWKFTFLKVKLVFHFPWQNITQHTPSERHLQCRTFADSDVTLQQTFQALGRHLELSPDQAIVQSRSCQSQASFLPIYCWHEHSHSWLRNDGHNSQVLHEAEPHWTLFSLWDYFQKYTENLNAFSVLLM